MNLWQKINNGICENIQKHDLETLNIILSTLSNNINRISKIDIIIDAIDLEYLKNNVPDISLFQNNKLYCSLHGIMHTTRVMFYSLIIAKILNIDYTLPVFIASMHDIARQNDKTDIEHGKRASLFISDNINNKFVKYNLYKDIINFVITNHNISIDNIASSIPVEQMFYLNILKTADALDRFRLPKKEWWPDTNYIYFNFFNDKLERFKLFTCKTEIDFLLNKKINIINIIKNNLHYLVNNI